MRARIRGVSRVAPVPGRPGMRRAARLGLLLLLFGASVRTANAADAELPEPPPANERPERYVEQATQLFQGGRYVEAADDLYRAFFLQPKPIYLFNAGQSYRKGGRADQALAMYDQFVRVAPEHPLAPEARAYMATLEALINEQRAAKDTELKLLGELSQQREVSKDTELKLRSELSQQKALTKETERKLLEAKKIPVYKRGWFGAVVGTTGFLLGSGIIITGIVLGVYLPTDGPQVTVNFSPAPQGM